jgi:hypothetical protein
MSNQGHTYFQPNDYDQMLIAAGWVTVESLDDDYQDYRRKEGSDALDYSTWLSVKRDWDEANAAYLREFEPDGRPLLDSELTLAQRWRMKELLDRMSWCEQLLGY